jgi:hypothetical protein
MEEFDEHEVIRGARNVNSASSISFPVACNSRSCSVLRGGGFGSVAVLTVDPVQDIIESEQRLIELGQLSPGMLGLPQAFHRVAAAHPLVRANASAGRSNSGQSDPYSPAATKIAA